MQSSKIGEQPSRRGRPRQFSEDAALAGMMEVFWRKGYAATGIDDLVAATGASRATLYAMHGDKQAMLLAALDLYARRFAERVDAALAGWTDASDAIGRVLGASADRLTAGEAPDGCLRCNATLELAGRGDAVIDEALATANAAFEANLARLVDRGVTEGEIAPERADTLMVTLVALVNGMVTLARSGAGRERLGQVVDAALALVALSQRASSPVRSF